MVRSDVSARLCEPIVLNRMPLWRAASLIEPRCLLRHLEAALAVPHREEAGGPPEVPTLALQLIGHQGLCELPRSRLGSAAAGARGVLDVHCEVGAAEAPVPDPIECWNPCSNVVELGVLRILEGRAQDGREDTQLPRVLYANNGISLDQLRLSKRCAELSVRDRAVVGRAVDEVEGAADEAILCRVLQHVEHVGIDGADRRPRDLGRVLLNSHFRAGASDHHDRRVLIGEALVQRTLRRFLLPHEAGHPGIREAAIDAFLRGVHIDALGGAATQRLGPHLSAAREQVKHPKGPVLV
mmetsp:Transcript_61935/g.200694  ORF Transcript_61935/g.200694 Transcript_61935/m.200694 type:complete len:297 (-) Transcript_61935:769-1659(-)